MDALYCATAYPVGDDDDFEVLIFDLKPSPAETQSRVLEIENEIYRTKVWTKDPMQLMESVAERYLDCLNPFYPSELVYEFGGLIHGREPLMFVAPELVH